jgi:cellulose synthase (UDP-forming)
MLRVEGGDATARAETGDLSRGGARVRLGAARRLAPGEHVWLSVFALGDEVPLPAAVVEQEGATVRLRFAPLTLEEEAHLVRTMFSRADAWAGALGAHRPDRPLWTLATIAGRGLAGLGRALCVSWRGRPAPAAPREPAVAGGRP